MVAAHSLQVPREPLRVLEGGRWLDVRLGDAELRQVQGLSHELDDWALRDGSFPELADHVKTLLRADDALCYRVEPDDAGWTLADGGFSSGSRWKLEVFSEFVARCRDPWAGYTLGQPEPEQRNRPLARLDLASLEEWREGPIWPVWRCCELTQLDQLRVLVCDGPRMLAWVGGYRERPFTANDKALLAALTPRLTRNLRSADRLRQAQLAHVGLAAALDAVAAPAAIVRGRGRRVVHANAAARALIDAGRWPLTARSGPLALHEDIESTRLAMPGLSDHYMVVVRGRGAERRQRLARAAAAWELTPRQAEVLAHIADGASNLEIAQALGCALRTVEIHVSAVLAKSGCERRAEVAARLWERGE